MSVGKESACNAADSSSILGLRRFTGVEIGYPLQYSWVFLVAQLVKYLPAMPAIETRKLGFNPWVGKIQWRKERLPTPVFWLGELYSPKELDMTD